MTDPVLHLTNILTSHRRAKGIRDLRTHCHCGWVSEHHGETHHLIHVARMILEDGYAQTGTADQRVGICGNALPPATPDAAITWCTLPAGHPGWHHDSVTGADWTDEAGEPSWQDQP